MDLKVRNTALHLNSGIFHALDLLSLRPQCKAQLDNFDIVLATWVHLVHILLKIAQTEQQLSETFQGGIHLMELFLGLHLELGAIPAEWLHGRRPLQQCKRNRKQYSCNGTILLA